MIALLLSHLTLALVVWWLTRPKTRKKPALAIHRQEGIVHPDPNCVPKKKKHKKHKKKHQSTVNTEPSHAEEEQEKVEWEKIEEEKVENQIEEGLSAPQRSQRVTTELQLIRNYFMGDLEEVVAYNGNRGHYLLTMEGSRKAVTFEWQYHQQYPPVPLGLTYSPGMLNPLELQRFEKIKEEQAHQLEQDPQYHYLFNLTTCLYQDLLVDLHVADTSQPVAAFKSAKKEDKGMKEEFVAKKEIYGELLEEIFYLHDMVEKEQPSGLGEQQGPVRHNNTRGRYESQFEQLELIGQGGFGKVYRVRHKLDGNTYAIKKTVINYADPNDRKMLKEVALLSKLNHPNIVRYYQSWLEDVESVQQIALDMSFGEEEASKVQELQKIYKHWQDDQSGGIRFEDNSKSSSSAPFYYQGGDLDDSGIVFEEEEEGSNRLNEVGFVSEGSSISEGGASQGGWGVQLGQQYPFKILYIAMELCQGSNLKQFIVDRFDDQEKKVQILRGVLQGVAYIHSKRIIHRDLKPANVFLTAQDKVKLGDFGLATTEERSVMNVSSGDEASDWLGEKTKAVGTGFYRAPQQRESARYDEKADIYSLGIIMLEIFYRFETQMQRMEILKEIGTAQRLPADLTQRLPEGSDLPGLIATCLERHPQSRPTIGQLLDKFRSKHFGQLVEAIANPDHFQFSQLLSHLFEIRNSPGALVMLRDAYKHYLTSRMAKVYQVHGASHFPTLPLLPVYDHIALNNTRIPLSRQKKYLLINSRGIVLQYADDTLRSWLKYARQALKRRRHPSEHPEPLRRYTFEKVVRWQLPKNRPEDQHHYERHFHQKMVTAFDIAHRSQSQKNSFLLLEALKVSEALVLTLELTQKRPAICLCHSLLFKMIAEKYGIHEQVWYAAWLGLDLDTFSRLTQGGRAAYLESRQVPGHVARRVCTVMEESFERGIELVKALDLPEVGEDWEQVAKQMSELQAQAGRVLDNPICWRLLLPPAWCNGVFWEVALVRGLTVVEDLGGSELLNYHVECNLDQWEEGADVSVWCAGQLLPQEMQELVVECWRNGLSARCYQWEQNDNSTASRHSIILRRKNERLQMMLRDNQFKKGEHMGQRQSSFLPYDQFRDQALKQIVAAIPPHHYH